MALWRAGKAALMSNMLPPHHTHAVDVDEGTADADEAKCDCDVVFHISSLFVLLRISARATGYTPQQAR